MLLTYQVPHNLQRLNEELTASVQCLGPVPVTLADGQTVLMARHILCGDGQTVHLDVPDDLTPEQVAEIERVVNAHVPS